MVKSYRFDPKVIEVEAGDDRHLDERGQLHPHGPGRRPGRPQGRTGRKRLDHVRHARHLPLRLHAAQPGHGRRGDRQVNLAELKSDVVILACAISAGIHGALVPGHFDEGTGAGLGFVAATVVARRARRLADPAARRARIGARRCGGHVRRPARQLRAGDHDRRARLHPDPEPVDGLALATKAIEAVGLLAATSLLWRPRRHHPPTTERNTDMNTTRASRPIPLALTALVAFFSALVALAVSGGHDAPAHGNDDQHATTLRPRHADATAITPQGVVALRTGHAPALGGPHHLDAAGDHQPDDRHARHRGHASAGCSRTRPTSATPSSPSTARRPATS